MKDHGANVASISVVVPFFNAMPFLESCAESLRRQLQVFPHAEVIFADAGSTDGSGSFLESHFPEFQLVYLQGRNAYVARNRAAASARGHILAFTDADCSVQQDWLCSIHQAVRDGADLVTGPVDAPAGVSSTLRAVHTYENRRMEEMCRSGGSCVTYAYTNNLAVRAELFHSLGGFDESQKRGGDSALALHALASGSTTMTYAPAMSVVHLEITSLRQWWFKKFLYGRSRTSRRSSPSVDALRSSRPHQGDAATSTALGVGRIFFEAGRLVGMARPPRG